MSHQLFVTFPQFQDVVGQFGPHPVVVYMLDPNDNSKVGISAVVFEGAMSGWSFQWSSGEAPSVVNFLAEYPDAVLVDQVSA